MTSSLDNVSMAVFCDFENVALGVRDAQYDKFDIKLVLERLLLKGSIVVKKAYCDWDRYKNFKATMHEANFELIEIPHVRQSGKNSADIRLVVDALDLCYTKSHVDTFVIVSGDSDFSPLVSKLRENAKKVIGVGVKQSTSDLLVANCDEFIFYDDLVREIQRAAAKRETRAVQAVQAAPARKTTREDDTSKKRRDDVDTRRTTAVEIVSETFEALVAERGDSGKIWASVLKEAIKRRKPDFNEAYYGFRAFGNLLEEAQSRGLLEVGRDEKSGTFVYRGTGSGMGGHGASHDALMTHDVAPASASAPAQPAADEPSGREPRRRTRGGRRGERRDDTDTPGLFEDGGDAMAGTVVSHDANDPVVDLPVGGGAALPYVRFDPDAMQAVARAAANAQGGDPFSRAEGDRGMDSDAEGERSNGDAGESAPGDAPAAASPSASSRRPPRGRRNAASARAERDEAARADGTGEATADGKAEAPVDSDAAAEVVPPSAFSNADAEVTSGAAGFVLGMEESPAPVGRRPGARSPRSPRGERRTNAPAASESAAAGSAAPAATPGDTGAPPASSASVSDTQAPAETSTAKPASKSARKAPARSRRPRKAPEG